MPWPSRPAMPARFSRLPVWPWACVLWFDRRVLIGVWFGSALLNIANLWWNGALNPTTATVAAVIAVGAAIQAWAGDWLVKRWYGPVRGRNKDTEDAFGPPAPGRGFVLRIIRLRGDYGPVRIGRHRRGKLSVQLVELVHGGCSGRTHCHPGCAMLLFKEPRGLFDKRPRRTIISMLLLSALVILSLYGAGRWEKYIQDSHLNNDGEKIARLITDRLITHREVISSLGRFIEAIPNFRFKQFEQFTHITLQDNPDIFAMSFNDLVKDSERHAFEIMMSRLSPLGSYQITERGQSTPPGPRRIQARICRCPLHCAPGQQPAGSWVSTLTPNRFAVDAINRAKASKSMTVTSPIHLVQEQKKRIGILELLPVMGTDKDRSSHLLGFAVAVVKVDEMIDIATKGHVPTGLVFQLNDFNAPDGRGLLYHSAAPGRTAADPASSILWKSVLRMGDRDWTLSIYA